jgi:hypothetical protein
MTMRLPRPHVLIGILVAAALALPLAACGKKSDALGSAGTAGNGQVGDAPDGGAGDVNPTTPAATPTPTTAPTSAPTTPPLVVTTLIPFPLVPWPADEDCISHDPTQLSVVYNAGQAIWQVLEGTNHAMLAYKRKVDADTALAVAKRDKKHCFIGRDNTRTNRKSYILDYYRDPSGINTLINSPDCIGHTAAKLWLEDLGATGWRLNNGNEYVQLFDTKADAEAGLLVFKHFNKHCYIGRGYSGSDRLQYITNYFL